MGISDEEGICLLRVQIMGKEGIFYMKITWEVKRRYETLMMYCGREERLSIPLVLATGIRAARISLINLVFFGG